MSLDWDLTKVKDWEKISLVKDNGVEAIITETIIWATMSVGIGDITPVTAPEFYARMKLLEAHRNWLTDTTQQVGTRYDDDPNFCAHHRSRLYPITYEMIERRIGLHTNVYPMETRKRWLARIMNLKMEDILWSLYDRRPEVKPVKPKAKDKTKQAV